jgi:hypothetical protein
MSCEVDRASRVNDLAGEQGESGWMRGDDEGNWARGGTDQIVGFEVMDLLNLLWLRREIQRGVGISDFSDVIEVSSGGLCAIEVVVENRDFVALPLDELCIIGLTVRATMVFVATAAAPHAKLFDGGLCGEGSFATTKSRRTATIGLRANKKSRDRTCGAVHDCRRCVQVVCLAQNLM